MIFCGKKNGNLEQAIIQLSLNNEAGHKAAGKPVGPRFDLTGFFLEEIW